MKFTRRDALALGLGTTAASFLPQGATASAEELIAEFTGGAAVGNGGLTLTAPAIAENGDTVEIGFSAPGAVSVMILAPGNPNPTVGTFDFDPFATSQAASTDIRLTETQDVIAVAKMADGSFVQASQTVKVTFGGSSDRLNCTG